MYGEIEYDNNYERMRLAQAGRKAAEGWRFRHHKSRESRMLSAAWAGLKELARKAVSIKEPSIATHAGACPTEKGAVIRRRLAGASEALKHTVVSGIRLFADARRAGR